MVLNIRVYGDEIEDLIQNYFLDWTEQNCKVIFDILNKVEEVVFQTSKGLVYSIVNVSNIYYCIGIYYMEKSMELRGKIQYWLI